jgi:hypothetical protein
VSALNELRENLREAARRDIEARRRVRRRRGRALGLLVALLLGGGAVATAADLIAIGEPVPELRASAPRYEPAGGRQIVLKAGARGREFGVAFYTGKNGFICVVGGHVRGTQLGMIERGTFRPYPADRPGACNRVDRINLGSMRLGEDWVVLGRVPDWVRAVVVDGTRHARTATGAFLFVFDDDPANVPVEFDPPTEPR